MPPRPASADDQDAPLDALKAAFSELLAAQRRLRGRDAARREGLSFPQYRMLRELAAADGGLPASQLAAAAELAPPTVTQMLDQLAAAGIVERSRSEQDRRIVVTILTAEGRRLLAEKEAAHAAKWREVFDGADDAALTAAVEVLERMRRLYDDL
jgi:DNA-binding MarR family transcriptional regulator